MVAPPSLDARSVLCIGHRGAMGHAPENTLQSIHKALELGAPAIEIDVYSVDGELIVFHDDRLERCTDGHGYIWDSSFAQLRTLDAGHGQQLPTLNEVCDAIDGRAALNIELKGSGTTVAVLDQISRLIASGWSRELFLVSSFNHRMLIEAKALDKSIKLGALHLGLPADDARFAEKLGAYSVHPSIEFLDRQFVEDAHRRHLKVYTYTANHPEDIARVVALGVDGVFTDYPERVVEAFPQLPPELSWR